MNEIVNLLKQQKKTISTMESCTGGGLANAITNIEGASEIFQFGAVTYSNEFKIKMGVNKDIIEKYSVYSVQTAKEMSKNISLFSGSDYGIGITGKMNRSDKNNMSGKDDLIYFSIYDKSKDCYYIKEVTAIKETREQNKALVIEKIIDELKTIL